MLNPGTATNRPVSDRVHLGKEQEDPRRETLNASMRNLRRQRSWESNQMPTAPNIVAKITVVAGTNSEVHILSYFWEGRMQHATNSFRK